MMNTRKCEITGCGNITYLAKSLCRRHEWRRDQHGHPLRERMLRWGDVAPAFAVVKRYLRKHPVPPEVRAAFTERIIGPNAGYTIHRTEHWRPTFLRRNRVRLANVMAHWREGKPRLHRSGKADPIAVLLAVTVWTEEHDLRLGDAAEIERAMFLLRLKPVDGYISGLQRRLLGAVIGTVIGVYLLTEARKVLAWDEKKDFTRQQRWWRNRKRKLTIAKPTVVYKIPHPGERPRNLRIGDMMKIEAYDKQLALYEAHQRENA